MKKILIVICTFLCLVVSGCKNDKKLTLKNEETPTIQDSSNYLYNKYSLLSYELFSTADYDEKINNKDSFLLFVYSDECYGCQKLAPGIKKYIDENPLAVVYTMALNSIESSHTLYKDENISFTPYLILIENGKIFHKELMPTDKNDEKKAKAWLDSFMNKYVKWEE